MLNQNFYIKKAALAAFLKYRIYIDLLTQNNYNDIIIEARA